MTNSHKAPAVPEEYQQPMEAVSSPFAALKGEVPGMEIKTRTARLTSIVAS